MTTRISAMSIADNNIDRVVFENVEPAAVQAVAHATTTRAVAEPEQSVSEIIKNLPRTHKLEEPVSINGKELKEISLDLYKLKGADLRNMEKELRMRFPADYRQGQLSENTIFLEAVIGRLNGFIGEDAGLLGARDYTAVVRKLKLLFTVAD
jgi:Phage tail assembly chaperone proteins, E, or 41 or 14